MKTQFTLSLLAATLTLSCAQPSALPESGAVHPLTGADAAKDPLPAVMGGPAVGKRDPNLQLVAAFHSDAQLVGVAVSKTGRTFVLFPRWADKVNTPVMELTSDGPAKLTPFPDEKTNAFDPSVRHPNDPALHFVSPQAIVFDAKDRLWVLDPGCINFGPNLKGGPKLWAYDINTKQRVKAIRFPTDVAMKTTALNDVRFDLNAGPEGTAYITDSGAGGIIVVDLASGDSWRFLDGHPSVLPAPGLDLTHEGKPLIQHKPSGEDAAPAFHSDGIALSPDGDTLYYNAIVSHDIYAVPTRLLRNKNTPPAEVEAAVKKVASKPSGNDGLLCDSGGRIYSTDFETNSITRTDPATGQQDTLTQDERLIWPDTLALHNNWLYITANQLPRGADYQAGNDERVKPWTLWRIRVSK